MSLATPPTRATLRTEVRAELMDPSGRWFTDTELNSYLESWQNQLQQEFEFVWGTATLTTSASSFTLSTLTPEPLRLEAIYWQDTTSGEERLVGRSKAQLDQIFRWWRYLNVGTPKVVVEPSDGTFQLVPPPALTGTMVLEYPAKLTLSADTTPISIPAWCRPSAVPYCCYRALRRLGPTQDLSRASYYKSRARAARDRIKSTYASYLPYSPSLRPAGAYEREILNPSIGGSTTLPGIISIAEMSELTVTGTIDGSNVTFTVSPTPLLLMLFRNGVLQEPNLHYTLTGSTITFIRPYQPQSGDTLYATGGVV